MSWNQSPAKCKKKFLYFTYWPHFHGCCVFVATVPDKVKNIFYWLWCGREFISCLEGSADTSEWVSLLSRSKSPDEAGVEPTRKTPNRTRLCFDSHSHINYHCYELHLNRNCSREYKKNNISLYYLQITKYLWARNSWFFNWVNNSYMSET